MGVIDRLRRRPDEERAPDVVAVHEAWFAAAAGSPGAEAAAYEALARCKVWVATREGGAPVAGSGLVAVRLGVLRGERFLPVATTKARMIRSGHAGPGETLVHVPFPTIATMARALEVDSVVVNPGGTPWARLTRSVVAVFADGLIPDPVAPDTQAILRNELIGPLEAVAPSDLPSGLGDRLLELLATEVPSLQAVSVGRRRVGEAYGLLVMLSAHELFPWREVTQRVGTALTRLLPPELYLSFEPVACTDPRLTDPVRAVVILPRSPGHGHCSDVET